jgi:hypothetical protein
MFTRALHWSLSWARLIQSIPPQLISTRSILILSSYRCLKLMSGLSISGFPTKILYTFLFSAIHAICPANFSLLNFITLAKNTSYEAPHYAVFSNILSLHLSSVKIFSPATCSQTPSAYVPPLMSDTCNT